MTCSSRSGLIARIFCFFWNIFVRQQIPFGHKLRTKIYGKRSVDASTFFIKRAQQVESHLRLKFVACMSIVEGKPQIKPRFRNFPRFRNYDSETTIQKLRFRNYGSKTTVEKLRFRNFPRFRNHGSEIFLPLLAIHAFNTSGSSTTFLLSNFFYPSPSWQPMLSMIQVQVQHFFYRIFSPSLVATRSKLYWLKLADEMMPLKNQGKNARAMETSDHVMFGLCPHL